MGTIVQSNLACLDPKCGSSDARRLYDDGTSFCFSCQGYFRADEHEAGKMSTANVKHLRVPGKKGAPSTSKPKGDDDEEFTPVSTSTLEGVAAMRSAGIATRGISKEVCEFFGVKMSFSDDGEADAHYYPYKDSKGGTAYKVRTLPKEFKWIGKSADLFGREHFVGAGKRLIITEGEIDTLSVAEASLRKYSKIYPVVSLSSAVMTKSILENREWCRSFGEVILMFDNDTAGQDAVAEALKIIGIDKARVVKYPPDCKDANDVLVKHGIQLLMQVIFDAAPHIPNGIVTKDKLWEHVIAYNNLTSVPYPPVFSGLNAKTKGMRRGEITLFTSGTSCGKSTIMREIMLWLGKQGPWPLPEPVEGEELKQPDVGRIGIVSLEEAPAETARKMAGMALKRNPAKEEIPLDELKVGFDEVFDSDRYIVLDHQGSLKDDSILDKIEYMALSGATHIVIDHITILVSEGAEHLTGNEAIDKVMNDLLRCAKRHNIWIGLVSHLRKTTMPGKSFEEGHMPSLDDIKGSGSIKQISFDIVGFARNLQNEDEVEKNTIKMAILKCRYTGLTGSCEGAYYDYDTGRFISMQDRPASKEEEFTPVKTEEKPPTEAKPVIKKTRVPGQPAVAPF